MTGLIVSAQDAGIHNHSQNPIRENEPIIMEMTYGWQEFSGMKESVIQRQRQRVKLLSLFSPVQIYEIWGVSSVAVLPHVVAWGERDLARGVFLLICPFSSAVWYCGEEAARAKKVEQELCVVFLFFFFSRRGTFSERTHSPWDYRNVEANLRLFVFEPRFDTLALKRPLHKFTLCQINQ